MPRTRADALALYARCAKKIPLNKFSFMPKKDYASHTLPSVHAHWLPDVTVIIEFVSQAKGVFGGSAEILARLHELDVQSWALETGALLQHSDVALRLRGAYRTLSPQCDALAGLVATTSGWTGAAYELAHAAKPTPVIFCGAANAHPVLAAALNCAASAGGCLGADSEWQRGMLARDVILLDGDTTRAARAFDQALPPGLPRLAPIDLFHAEADQAVRVALALGDALTGVAFAARDATWTQETLQRVRAQLDLAGFPRVKIFLDGAVSAELVRALDSTRGMVDGYFVGAQIGGAPPLPLTVNVRACNDMPLTRRGQTYGAPPGLRLKPMFRE